MQSENALKQAVEEQLDLILKIQQERKILKRENKLLKEEYQKMLTIVKRYNTSKEDIAINTEETPTYPNQQPQTIETIAKPILKQQSIQVDIEINMVNNTKLSSAQELLRVMGQRDILCSKCQQNINNTNHLYEEETKKITKPSNNNQQVSGEIVKMAKEIAALKRQLKQSQSKWKTKEKQIKEVKRCLEVKSQALQKCRKQFNQLSLVMNTQKFKSVRSLESDLMQTKLKLVKAEEQAKLNESLKTMLQDVTHQYETYREEKQAKVSHLLWQLKEKDSRCEQLSREMEYSRQDSQI